MREVETGELEVGDELGDVSVHLVQLGVLGGNLPVLAPGHRVHNVLDKEGQIIGILGGNQTYLNEGQVGDHLSTALGAHLATRQLQLEVGQLRPGELEGEPQQGGGQGSLGLRGEGGGAADPGVGALLLGDGGEVAQQQQVLVVGHLLVGRIHPWAEVQLLLKKGGQCQCDVSD